MSCAGCDAARKAARERPGEVVWCDECLSYWSHRPDDQRAPSTSKIGAVSIGYPAGVHREVPRPRAARRLASFRIGRLYVAFELKWADLWIGAYVRPREAWICLVPCFPIHVAVLSAR